MPEHVRRWLDSLDVDALIDEAARLTVCVLQWPDSPHNARRNQWLSYIDARLAHA